MAAGSSGPELATAVIGVFVAKVRDMKFCYHLWYTYVSVDLRSSCTYALYIRR